MQQELRRSQRYRELAQECRHLAQITTSESWKARYLQLAENYDTLGDQAEAKEKKGAPVGND
jgi:hypothetical protein